MAYQSNQKLVVRRRRPKNKKKTKRKQDPESAEIDFALMPSTSKKARVDYSSDCDMDEMDDSTVDIIKLYS